MAISNTASKSARIDTRVTQEQKELIERAAKVSGRKVSEFVLADVEVAAKKFIEEHEKQQFDQAQSRVLTTGRSTVFEMMTIICRTEG